MQSFSYFHDIALERKGKDELQTLLPALTPRHKLEQMPDDRFLSAMTRCIFRAGFVWKIIDHKWDGFEEAFRGFVPLYWQQVPPERLDELMQDERIVRNRQKLDTVPINARMIVEASEEYGGFGKFLAQWPSSDQVGLLFWLKKHGSRLGGVTPQRFLRYVGYDGFVMSTDVVVALENHGILDCSPTSKTGLKQAQGAFNQWHEETGLPYSHLSFILSCTLDARR